MLPTQVRERFETFTGVPLTQGYGLTECSPIVTCGNPLAHSDRPGSVGLPLSGTDIAIRDPDGAPLPVGAIGEIRVRGPQVMLGYAGRHHETQSVLREGWLRTGDLGRSWRSWATSPPRPTPPRWPGTELREALDLDSMDFLNFVVALHDRAGIDVPEADYPHLFKLDAATNYLSRRRMT